MHRSTLETKLKFFQFVKLSSHNLALYHPLQRQNTQKHLAHRLVGSVDIWEKSNWRMWCRDLLQANKTPKRVLLAGAEQRKAARSALRAKRDMSHRAPVGKPRKKPASQIPAPPKRQQTRRHPFALRVLNPLVRPGRRHKNVERSA